MTQYLINDLGTFIPYQPASGDMSKTYAKRSTDGIDFYNLVSNPATFAAPNSVKLVIVPQMTWTSSGPAPSGLNIQNSGPTFDPSQLLLSGGGQYNSFTLIEILDYRGFNPAYDIYGTFDITSVPGSVVVTPMTTTIPGFPTIPFVPVHSILSAYKRSTDYEAIVIDSIVESLSLRQRRILDLSGGSMPENDPVWTTVSAAFVSAFGLGRSQLLLVP